MDEVESEVEDEPPQPHVSICIPTLNEAEHLARTLENLQERVNELSDGWHVETIVADGDSDDGTRSIARDHPLVDVVGVVEQDGILYARDAGVQLASAPITVHVDADTVYEENWLNNLLNPFRDPEVVMTYGPVKGEGYEQGLRELYSGSLKLLFGHYAPGQNRAFRTAAYEEVGYNFDIDQTSGPQTSHEEEIRFVHRMEELGKVIYVENAECTTSGRNIESFFEGEKKGGQQWKEVA